MDDTLVIGIDCGGTRTRVVLALASGEVLGIGEAGPGNVRDFGYTKAGETAAPLETLAANIDEAVNEAFRCGELARTAAGAAYLGLAGVASAAERKGVSCAVRHLNLAPAERIGIDHDLRIAQAGAFEGGAGMVLIVGTGSCCYGRADDGGEWRAGGWGSRFDDGGSATNLGLRAIVAAIRESDGRGEQTALTPWITQALGLDDLRGVLDLCRENAFPRRRIAGLGPLVTRAAAEGDAVAKAIVAEGVRELAAMVRAVHDRLSLSELALLGGVLQAGGVFTDPLLEAIRVRVAACSIVEPAMPAVLGAALLAMGLLETDTPANLDRLRVSGARIMLAENG